MLVIFHIPHARADNNFSLRPHMSHLPAMDIDGPLADFNSQEGGVGKKYDALACAAGGERSGEGGL
jgi:hypothetical protein